MLCHFNNKYINIIVKIKNIYNNKIECLCEMIVVLYKKIRKDIVWIKKEKRGITLLALVITIIILLLLAAVAIQMAIGENGLIQKAEKTKRENAKSELFDIASLKFSNMSIEDAVESKDTLNFTNLYNSTDFKGKYEIRDGKIYDKGIKENIITKEEFEERFREKFRKVGKETQKPLVNPINNNSTELTGVGEKGAEIIVTVNGVEKKTVVDR